MGLWETYGVRFPSLPGGLVVRIRRSHRRGPGSTPGQGRYVFFNVVSGMFCFLKFSLFLFFAFISQRASRRSLCEAKVLVLLLRRKFRARFAICRTEAGGSCAKPYAVHRYVQAGRHLRGCPAFTEASLQYDTVFPPAGPIGAR